MLNEKNQKLKLFKVNIHNYFMKKTIIVILSLILLVSLISAMDITFFYSNTCSYCQQIKPYIMNYVNSDNNFWKIYEISDENNYNTYKEYEFTGIPSFVINTDDGREIKFVGADLKRLNCELREMTTKECPTYSAEEGCKEGSWFKI